MANTGDGILAGVGNEVRARRATGNLDQPRTSDNNLPHPQSGTTTHRHNQRFQNTLRTIRSERPTGWSIVQRMTSQICRLCMSVGQWRRGRACGDRSRKPQGQSVMPAARQSP
jgi:hypothetical protein